MGNNRRYSFFQLFAKGTDSKAADFKIVIPIIQRDYAQGRDNDKALEVRTDFLTQLYDYMTAPSGSHDLDFVYGISSSARDILKKKEFIPLDGQQRLTTLFLIHVYLSIRAKGSNESDRFFKAIHVKNGKLKESLFSYRTRSSAVEFCDGLIDADNDYSSVFRKDDNGNRIFRKTLSQYIRNSNWFYPDWLQDPTVKGMLTMLDAIDEKFDECNHQFILHRLLSEEDPSVSFIFMDLDDYKLTDDLYIKMNSRGKPLTPFENFKAKYEQYISELEKEVIVGEDEAFDDSGKYEYIENKCGKTVKRIKTISDLALEISNRGDKLIKTVKDNFAFNIDNQWSRLFWEFSKAEIREKEEEIKNSTSTDKSKSLDNLLSETLDLKMSRFIKMVLTNQYALDHSAGKISIPEELTGEKGLSFTGLTAIDAISSDGVILLTRMFELCSNRPLEIMPEWIHTRYYDEKEVFESMVKGKDFTFPKRFLMYCYLMFRIRFGDSKPEYLTEWMRFVYNVTLDDNAIQDMTRNTYHRAVASINNLISLLNKQQPSVIDLLASDNAPDKLDFFPDYQYLEEKIKSSLFILDGRDNNIHCQSDPVIIESLTADDSWGSIILTLESHPYLTGQIGFILKMSGISDYYDSHHKLDWSKEKNGIFKAAVIKYGLIASKLFEGGYSKRLLAKESLFERAMLAKFSLYNKYNFLNSTNKSAYSNNLLRDWSWKSHLRLSPEHYAFLMMTKELFDLIDTDDLRGSLEKVIKGKMTGPQWEKDIVRYSYLMDKCRNGFFAKSDDHHLILKDSVNFSMHDHEVYSLVLYWENLTQRGDIEKISDFWLSYGNSNSNNEVPFISLSANDVTVKVKSYVDHETGELICHYLHVNSNGNLELEEFLRLNGFSTKNESDSIFRRRERDWNNNEGIDDYRNFVSNNIHNFISDLSDFLR